MTSCYKAAAYHIPIVKKMVDISPADAVFLKPTDDLHEDPFVLPDILGYLRMPDPVRWPLPTDLNFLLCIVKLARTLGVNTIIEHLSSVLEIAPETLKPSKTGALRKKIRAHLRCLFALLQDDIDALFTISMLEIIFSYNFIPRPPCLYLFVFTIMHRSGRAAFNDL